MATLSTQSSFTARLIRRGMIFCFSAAAVVVLYVASIGPLAFLESRGVANEEMWVRLRGSVYHPVFQSWWHGPKWLDAFLNCYVGWFDRSSDKLRRFGAEYNHWIYRFEVIKRVSDMRRWEQLEWDIAHPVQARARKEAELRNEQSGVLYCYSHDDVSKAELAEAESNWWRSAFGLE